jgi:hypothetical protein
MVRTRLSWMEKLHITPNEWLMPLREQTQGIVGEIDKVRTLPEQMKKGLLEALRTDWYTILEQVRTLYLLSSGSCQQLKSQVTGV